MIDASDVLTPERTGFLTDLQETFGARRTELLELRAATARAPACGRAAGLPARDRRRTRGGLGRRADARRDRRPAGRDHGPCRQEDGDQRLELGRTRIHGGLRGLELADVGQLHRGAAEPHGCTRADDLARHRRETVRTRRRSCGPVRAAQGLASRGAAFRGRRRGDVGLVVRFRPLFLPQPRPERPLLLPAEARVSPRGTTLERRLRLVAGTARRPRWDDQGNRPDRDDPRRVRDGRDPLRAAGALGRAQRGPLGLHLQRDQEARPPARDGAAGPRRGDDGRAVHALLLRAPRQDVSSPRRLRDGRHGRVHPLAP